MEQQEYIVGISEEKFRSSLGEGFDMPKSWEEAMSLLVLGIMDI